MKKINVHRSVAASMESLIFALSIVEATFGFILSTDHMWDMENFFGLSPFIMIIFGLLKAMLTLGAFFIAFLNLTKKFLPYLLVSIVPCLMIVAFSLWGLIVGGFPAPALFSLLFKMVAFYSIVQFDKLRSDDLRRKSQTYNMHLQPLQRNSSGVDENYRNLSDEEYRAPPVVLEAAGN